MTQPDVLPVCLGEPKTHWSWQRDHQGHDTARRAASVSGKAQNTLELAITKVTVDDKWDGGQT
jgi:hypothetical protein